MAILKTAVSKTVWDLKYRYRLHEKIIDQTIEDTWHRVAKAIAEAEKSEQKGRWEKEFYRILENFRYLPGGRILAGAGTEHTVTLFNCFVMNIAKDSLSAIFDAVKEGALTLQQGGGIGYDFSVLRPAGDLVKHTGTTSSGPVSFMRIWDTTCAILLSTGARRGAMMAVLRCDHPDIETFISAKSDASLLRHFNVSVFVSDEFMRAVKNDEEWSLIFPIANDDDVKGEIVYRDWYGKQNVACLVHKKVKASELWVKIIRSAYDYAEPGVLFGDTINRLNNLWYCENISATNPCGEIPLPAYGACNLGAINLAAFVMNPFSKNAQFNWQELEKTVAIATRFQDNVIDVSNYPLEIQKERACATRRIGLGITGLADTFVMLGMIYGSEASLIFAEKIMHCISGITWKTSIELAKEKGKFPLFSDNYLRGEFVQSLDEDIQKDLAKFGVRNSHHNTIAPTGTISLLANNISNGIEPIFQAEYDRQMRTHDDDKITFRVTDFAYQLWQEKGNNNYPESWIDTETLSPDAHLLVQAAVQKYIDNAISKTINIPVDFPFKKLINIYSKAYDLGLKGCTIFRPNLITGSVLSVKKCEQSIEGDCCPEE